MSHGLELNPDTEAATTDQILPLVKSELGLAFIPEPMAAEAINKNEIEVLSEKCAPSVPFTSKLAKNIFSKPYCVERMI